MHLKVPRCYDVQLRVYLSVSGLIIICISFLLHFKTLSVPTFAHLADCIYRLLIDITCLSFQMFYHSWQHLASLRHLLNQMQAPSSDTFGGSVSLFRCCVSPLLTAFETLWQPLPRCLARRRLASLLRHSLPMGFSRIGMCSSVHYGLIVDIHEVITCCRFSLHSILLLNIALISGKEH